MSKCQIFLLAALMCLPSITAAEFVDVWFGTTTAKAGLSKGIYHARLDLEKGKLSEPRLAIGISNPGFLAMHPGGKIIYSTASIDGEALVVGLKIEPADEDAQQGRKKLTMIGAAAIGDGGAAHLATDREGKVLLSAQYRGGSTALFELDEDGEILSRAALKKHDGGSGVVGRRQDKPHAHWVGTSPDNRFVMVPDLGMDKVVIWKLDLEKPDLVEHGFATCPPGGGPRHMKFHPDGKRAYVLNELSLAVTVFRYDAEAGAMEAIQTIPTMSEADKQKEAFASASEIRVHPTGRFVYAANRGPDTITVFGVDEPSGKLNLVETEPVRGSWPRNFSIDPTGRWLIAAGRNSNTAAVFAIDQASGELTFDQQSQLVPSPICVLFGRVP